MTASPPRHLLCGLLVLVMTLLPFSRLSTAGWTWWDDPATIHQNPLLNPPSWHNVAHYWTAAGPDAPMALYIPVAYTGWSLLAEVAQQPADADGIRLNPHIFHTANILLHMLSALLVFELLRALVHNDLAAAAGALLFALHPVQVEPVAWISGGKDVLCGCLSIAALWQYVLSIQQQSSKRFIAATVLFVAAVLSKPTAIVVPVMAGVIDGFILQRPWRQVLRTLWPWLLLMLPAAAVTRWSQSADWGSPVPVWDRPGIAADALAHQLTKLVQPWDLSPDDGRRPSTVLARHWVYYTWVIPAGIAVVLSLRAKRWRIGWIAALLFLLPLLPVLGLVPFQFQYVSTTADHYLYLAMLGPALLLAGIVRSNRRWAIGLAGVLLCALGVLSFQQSVFWQSNRTLFEHTLAVNWASFIACDMLGYDHTREADHLRQAALQNATNQPQLAGNLAASALAEYDTAIAYFHRGLATNPRYVPSLLNLAIDSAKVNRPDDARAAADQIAAMQPILPRAFRAEPVDLARMLFTFGDAPGATRVLRRWLSAHPDDPNARRLFAVASTRPVMP